MIASDRPLESLKTQKMGMAGTTRRSGLLASPKPLIALSPSVEKR